MAGKAPITRAMLKRQPIFSRAGELYDTIYIFLGAMIAAAFLSSLAKPYSFHVFVAIMGTGLLVFAVRTFRVWRRNDMRLRNVLARGELTTGEVLDIRETRRRGGNTIFTMSLGWDIRYAYRDRGGIRHEGESGHLYEAEAKRYHVGGACEIAFDPDEPETSFWVTRQV